MPRKTVLQNGVRVVTEHLPWVRSVSVGCWLGSGSRDETPDEAGYAHIVEHMLFKGTSTRTARDIAEAMDSIGGHLNAFTTKETTCYHCRVMDEHFPVALQLLADMLLHSTFDPTELEREKAVILEEISSVEDTPEELIHQLFDLQLFNTHPLAQPVLGTASSVASVDRDGLLAFVEAHYRPSNLVVAAVGNVQHAQVVALTEQLFGNLQEGQAAAGLAEKNGSLTYRPARKMYDKQGEQVHLCVGVPAMERQHPDRYALDILDTLLGGGMSSRLFQHLREERGLVYSTYSFAAAYRDAGLFGCYAGTRPERAEEVLDAMLSQLTTVGEGNISNGEIERAKAQVKGGILLSLESTGARMGRLAGAELAGEPYLSADELGAKFDAVTIDDVRRVAEELLTPSRLSVVTLGPVPSPWRETHSLEAIG